MPGGSPRGRPASPCPQLPETPRTPHANGNPVMTEPAPICSAKGCREPARWVLAWNNPKLHTPDRRKTWLACEEHRESLGAFLDVRGFLKETVPFGEWQARENDG